MPAGGVDTTGAYVVKYKYDAWGRTLSKTGTLASTLGTLQPFGYRHYAYDEDYNMTYSDAWRQNNFSFLITDEME